LIDNNGEIVKVQEGPRTTSCNFIHLGDIVSSPHMKKEFILSTASGVAS